MWELHGFYVPNTILLATLNPLAEHYVKVLISLTLYRALHLCTPLYILYIPPSYRAIYRIYTYIQWACCRGHDSTWLDYFWMIKSHILPFWRNFTCFPLCWDLFYMMHIFYNWNTPIFFRLTTLDFFTLFRLNVPRIGSKEYYYYSRLLYHLIL